MIWELVKLLSQIVVIMGVYNAAARSLSSVIIV